MESCFNLDHYVVTDVAATEAPWGESAGGCGGCFNLDHYLVIEAHRVSCFGLSFFGYT